MKIIIAGSRQLDNAADILPIIAEKLEGSLLIEEITEIVSGKAKGIDTIGEMYAEYNSIPVKEFPADWTKYGRAAGPIRNREMALYGDIALVIWDGISPGSKNMINTMKSLNKPVIEVILEI